MVYLLQHFVFALRAVSEVAVMAFLIYMVLLFLRGTRGVSVLTGLTIVILLLYFLSAFFGLEVIEWLLTKMWTLLAISVLILFQPEIRRAFAELGSQQAFIHTALRNEREMIDTLLDATFFLADRRIGALIAIEQDIGMRSIAETGTQINAPLSRELLTTFFFPNTPLHDGGVVISGNVIMAAGCIFPLTDNPEMSKSLGTRHRAGVGVTEDTDAVAIVVSEESGAVSISHRGRLSRGVDRQRLERHLVNFLVKKKRGTRAAKKTVEPRIANIRTLASGARPAKDEGGKA